VDIEAWLRGVGLERYTEAFRAHNIDERILPNLTAEDLREVSVASVDTDGSCSRRLPNCRPTSWQQGQHGIQPPGPSRRT
jgi:hypothetical protein